MNEIQQKYGTKRLDLMILKRAIRTIEDAQNEVEWEHAIRALVHSCGVLLMED